MSPSRLEGTDWKSYVFHRLKDADSSERREDFLSIIYALGLIHTESIVHEVSGTTSQALDTEVVREKIREAWAELCASSAVFSSVSHEEISELTARKVKDALPSFRTGVLQGIIGTFLAGGIAFIFILATPYLVSIAKNISGDVSKIFNGTAAEDCSSKENPNC